MLKDSLIAYKAIFQADADKADFIATKAMAIIYELENAINGSKISYNQFYDVLNYDYSFLGKLSFNLTNIEDEKLISYLKLNAFLNQLRVHRTETSSEVIKFLNFLNEYQKQSLKPGILKYKNNLLLIQKPEKLKQRLGLLLTEINTLTQNEIHQYRQEQVKQNLNKFDDKYSFTDLLGKKFTETAKNEFSKHFVEPSQNDEFKFSYQLQLLINKEDLTYNDIAQLKLSSQQFEKEVLKLSSINEITRFHWLINIICNFLNLFSNCYESNKSLEIKHQFKFWHQSLATSESNVDKVEKYIRSI